MKLSRFFTLMGIVFLLLGFVGTFLNNNFQYLYSSISNATEDKNEEFVIYEVEDISGISVDMESITSDISNIAINIERVEVFDGLTKEELVTKINKSLKGVLKNKGDVIVTRCLKYGVDPYVAVSIMLLETGCNWKCSSLATKYYNFGGMKGSSGYLHFASVDDGINKFIDNLYKNYYKKGLNTPEKMNKKYAASKTWAEKVNAYVKQVKAK